MCVQIFGTLDGTSLSLIYFVKKLITTKTVTFKNTQAAHVKKGDDKIVITQATHSTFMGPTTCSKEKSTIAHLKKLASKHTHLLKTTGTHDSYQLGQSLHGMEKRSATLKDFRNKFSSFIVDANFSIDLHSGSPIRMSKKDNFFNYYDSFTSFFRVTMPIITTDTKSIEKQLAKMAPPLPNSPRPLRRKI